MGALPCQVSLALPCVSPDLSQYSQALDADGKNGPTEQDRRPARPTNCAETRGSGSGITKSESAAGFFSHRGLLHWQFFATRCSTALPLSSLTASDGRFFFFSRRTNFSFFFLMGEGEGPERELPTQSSWVRQFARRAFITDTSADAADAAVVVVVAVFVVVVIARRSPVVDFCAHVTRDLVMRPGLVARTGSDTFMIATDSTYIQYMPIQYAVRVLYVVQHAV